MKKTLHNIFPSSNSYIDNDLVFLSHESSLYRLSLRPITPTLIHQFDGGSRGVRSLFISAKGTLFASPEGLQLADRMKGLWKSEDKGFSWKCVLNLSFYNNPVSIWGIDQSVQGNLFAGVYTLATGDSKAEIFRSCDDGDTWQLVYKNEMARHIHQVTCDRYTGYIYASLGDNFSKWRTKSILRSKDEGETWETILPDLPQVVPIIAIKGARLFASDAPGGARIYRTEDDRHAELVLSDPDELYFFWMRKQGNNCLLASAIASSTACKYSKIYRSLDKGVSWHLVSKFPSNNLFDGSMNASNISNSRIILHVWENGVANKPKVPDLAEIRPLHNRLTLSDLLSRSLALLLLIFSIPVILLSILLIKITSKGPAFYLQTRNGIGGDTFRIIKLRTRYHYRNRWAHAELTPVGWLLRYLSIDELPQLWNVILGEMALVGPRPHPLELDLLYRQDIRGIFKRYQVRPGITGLAQVNGARGEIDCPEKMRKRVKLDILYIRKRSPWLDMLIIIKTIFGGFINKREPSMRSDISGLPMG